MSCHSVQLSIGSDVEVAVGSQNKPYPSLCTNVRRPPAVLSNPLIGPASVTWPWTCAWLAEGESAGLEVPSHWLKLGGNNIKQAGSLDITGVLKSPVNRSFTIVYISAIVCDITVRPSVRPSVRHPRIMSDHSYDTYIAETRTMSSTYQTHEILRTMCSCTQA